MCLPALGVITFRSWICTSTDVAAGGTDDLLFVADGPTPSIRDANGLGHLGSGSPVPVPLLQ